MLLATGGLLFDDPFAFVVLMVAVGTSLLIAITFHEFAHAYAANRQGDMTATRQGRLTLNPLAHLDPAGTILLLVAGFGWGKPVPVNPARLRSGRRGMALVSAAGPFANLVLALAFSALFQLGIVSFDGFTGSALRSLDPGAWLAIIASYAVLLNLILAAFNLLPIAPLDGGGILMGLAPRQWLPAVAKIQRFGPLVLILLIATTYLTDLNPLGVIFGPIRDLAFVLTNG